MLSTVLDRDLNTHAVLVFRSESGDSVLDNLTDHILPWAETGYSFLRMQDLASPYRWRAICPVTSASLSRASALAGARARPWPMRDRVLKVLVIGFHVKFLKRMFALCYDLTLCAVCRETGRVSWA